MKEFSVISICAVVLLSGCTMTQFNPDGSTRIIGPFETARIRRAQAAPSQRGPVLVNVDPGSDYTRKMQAEIAAARAQPIVLSLNGAQTQPPAAAGVGGYAAPRPQPYEAPAPRSDVDSLPSGGGKRPHAHAIVIGIENYRQKLPKADFAAGDARLVSQYVTQVLGYPDENVVTLINDQAGKSDFEKYFDKWLPNRVENGDEVLIYYSGHGAPNPRQGDAYMVPYDGDPTYLEETAYPLKRLYARLGKLPAKKITVVMDSCFSGAGGRSVLAKGARPLVSVKTATEGLSGKVTVLSAAAGDQISHGYDEKGHGLFTYFLLKGIKDSDGAAGFSDVFGSAAAQVKRIARRDYNDDQVPQRAGGGE